MQTPISDMDVLLETEKYTLALDVVDDGLGSVTSVIVISAGDNVLK